MNITQQGLIALLKSAVTQQPIPLPETFSIEEAFPLIQRHNIETLAYDGAIRCGVPRQNPVMQRLFQSYCRHLQRSEQQMRMLEKLYAVFDENGIEYMPLKGANMKALYPNPELRIMGDADILIRRDQYGKIPQILLNLGFVSDGESDHEYLWKSRELYLELHKSLIPSYNRDFYAILGDGWKFAQCTSGTRYCMTAEDTFVYLFTHFAKHYRDGGIGCRHVLDLWVYRQAYPNMNLEIVEQRLTELHLLAFYKNICTLMDVWFHDTLADEKTAHISDFVFSSGSWGTVDAKVLSESLRNSGQRCSSVSSKIRYLLRRIFPDVKVLKREYPILNKSCWLLPIAWLVRPIHKLLLQPKLLRQQKENLRSLSVDNLKARQQMLRYVGLDFHLNE